MLQMNDELLFALVPFLREHSLPEEDVFACFRRLTISFMVNEGIPQKNISQHTGLSRRMANYWCREYGLQRKQRQTKKEKA
jgi:hypothetical protein